MRRMVVVAALGALVLAACGGGSTSTVQTIGGCKIESHTSCPGANLSGADLRGATLDHSNLARVALEGADLSDSSLPGTNLSSAVITNVDLRRANLAETNLTLANLTGSDLTDANLKGAKTTPGVDIFATAIRCRTVLPNGTIDNTSCSFPLPTTTKPTTPTTKPSKPTTPTTRKPPPPTTPTTKPTPPTTQPPQPPCTVDQLQAAYIAQFGNPPDGTTFSLTACAGGFGGTNIANPNTGPAFAVYQIQGTMWVALNVGSADVCSGYNIPPNIQTAIGCV
ncbi:MAG TPA: pentapeptide repeat-containing protein [Acidimicrobiia bacterium]|nr:pentapeptide repeat-containing protein [Acidimicrobiia bacterium]